MKSVIMWSGAGWYAPLQENGTVCYYWCGDNPHQMPDTYSRGLGTPGWFDAPPADMEVW